MYLSAERIAHANRVVQETFQQTSIAWQAIPHWDTGDPGQTLVRADVTAKPAAPALLLHPIHIPFDVTLAQAISPTPDSLLAQVMAQTVHLAEQVDAKVLQAVYTTVAAAKLTITAGGSQLQKTLDSLIAARASVENAGYRAPASLLTNTKGLIALSELVSGYSVTEPLLAAANVNSLDRAKSIDATLEVAGKKVMLMLGRRRRIAHGYAAEASPGEEPVDIAVSVLPGLEVVGENASGGIELGLRIRFATRIKDDSGIVAIVGA